MIDHARDSLRRAGLRRQLDAIASGGGARLKFDVDLTTFDAALVLSQVTARMHVGSVELRRLTAAFRDSGSLPRVIEGLNAANPDRRIRSCRTVGALRLEEALPWVTPLLRATDSRVSAAAARALGRIGGVRSADSLVAAIQRKGPRRVFIVALARAAPDLYLEAALGSRLRQRTLGPVAIAAGLRRRRTSIRPLALLMGSGTHRQRVICCRALAWSHSTAAIPAVMEALTDADWRVRISAIKSLTALQAVAPDDRLEIFLQIERLVEHPDIRIRSAARRSVRRLTHVLMNRAGRWPWP
jgi:HEAT repeat protein